MNVAVVRELTLRGGKKERSYRFGVQHMFIPMQNFERSTTASDGMA